MCYIHIITPFDFLSWRGRILCKKYFETFFHVNAAAKICKLAQLYCLSKSITIKWCKAIVTWLRGFCHHTADLWHSKTYIHIVFLYFSYTNLVILDYATFMLVHFVDLWCITLCHGIKWVQKNNNFLMALAFSPWLPQSNAVLRFALNPYCVFCSHLSSPCSRHHLSIIAMIL